MKTVTARPSFQGDLMIVRIDAIPEAARPATPDGDHYVLAHSETGHHHVIDRARAEVYEAADDRFIGWIRSLGDAEVKHLRDFDTHETLLLPAGDYEVRRQREYVPEGFRRAAD